MRLAHTEILGFYWMCRGILKAFSWNGHTLGNRIVHNENNIFESVRIELIRFAH